MRLLPLLCVALLAAGCYDSRFGERGDDATPEPVTATIRQLREKFAGTTFPVTGDIVVSGRVTTSDYDENFYRTFCIEEDGAGIEVMAGIDHLHNDFPEGCQVTLRLRGLALGESHGVLQAGRMPAAGSGFATDYIGSKAALDAAVTRNGEALEPIAPTLLSPGELTPERCGTLVRIGALSYTPEDLTPGTWAGYKRFTDDTGAAVYTYVRSYARFADDEVPVGRCTLTGILQYDATGEGRYILKLRDENDWPVNRLPAISRTALRTAVSVVLALTALAGCDKASGLEFDDDTPQGTVTIAALKSRCTGAQAAVTEDITIEGVVTGNDLYGEFYKTLVVEDTSGGISIAVDATELYVDYPVGTAVTIHCNGLFLCDYGGKVMLGTRPTDEYAGPGRIPQAEAALYLRRKQAETRPLRPRTLTFGEVDMRHTDTYVHFEGVRFVQQGNWCDPDPETGRPATTERQIADASGREFTVRTAGTCTYATEPVPQGTGSVYGIIDYFNGKYTLRIANREVDFATVAARPTAYLSSGGYSAPKPTR